MMGEYFMRSARVGFRCWTEEDLPLAVAIWADPRVTRLVADLGNPSVEQARARLSLEVSDLAAFGVQYWPIFLLEGQHLGCCGLRPYRPEEGVFKLGAHILPSYRKQGYAIEATRRVIEHAFGPLGIKALFARHNPHNSGSVRIV